MAPPDTFEARFDEVATGGQRRVAVGVEVRDREAGTAIYVRRL
jgi:hypothetical protein